MAKREITVREREVLALVSAGVASREIAERLGISRATVESHVRSAMSKVGARSRLHAVLLLAVTEPGAVFRDLEPEQRRLLELLAAGVTREDAARSLFLSRRSVDRRLAALRRRVGAASTAELLLTVLRPVDVPR
jgi:DNA-binding CsgD family transcriptional regulator